MTYGQYNYGLEVEQQDAKIEGKLNIEYGNESVIIGKNAGINHPIDNTNPNVIIGSFAGENSTQGGPNVLVGASAGQNLRGNANVAIGAVAGSARSELRYANTYLGMRSGMLNRGSYNVFLGYESGFNLPFESHRLSIQNDQSRNSLIYGEFENDKAGINWDGTMPLPATLSINGTLHISETAMLVPQTTAPTCGSNDLGLLYVNSSDRKLYLCKGNSGWKEVLVSP